LNTWIWDVNVWFACRLSEENGSVKKKLDSSVKKTPKRVATPISHELNLRIRRSQPEVASISAHNQFQPKKEPGLNKFKGKIEKKRKMGKQITEKMAQESGTTCNCGNPAEFGLMIQCDSCERWYHSVCVNIDEVPFYYNLE